MLERDIVLKSDKLQLIEIDIELYGLDGCDALTLREKDNGLNESGWFIDGELHIDYSIWINYFIAIHNEFGIVKGDFEKEIFASSHEAFRNFIKHHRPETWSYQDI